MLVPLLQYNLSYGSKYYDRKGRMSNTINEIDGKNVRSSTERKNEGKKLINEQILHTLPDGE